MGYAKSSIVTVPLCDEKDWVKINRKMTVDRARSFRKLTDEIVEEGLEIGPARSEALLTISIIEWNLEGDEGPDWPAELPRTPDGEIWPLDRPHIRQLDLEDTRVIIDKVNESRKIKTLQEEASFLLPPTPGSEEWEGASLPSTETSTPLSSSGNILEFPTTEETAMTGTPISTGSGSSSFD